MIDKSNTNHKETKILILYDTNKHYKKNQKKSKKYKIKIFKKVIINQNYHTFTKS